MNRLPRLRNEGAPYLAFEMREGTIAEKPNRIDQENQDAPLFVPSREGWDSEGRAPTAQYNFVR